MKARRIVLPALAMAGIVLVSNLLVQFPLNAWLTWGAFSYPVAYLVTDVCNRVLGPAPARRVAWIGFATGARLFRAARPRRPRREAADGAPAVAAVSGVGQEVGVQRSDLRVGRLSEAILGTCHSHSFRSNVAAQGRSLCIR